MKKYALKTEPSCQNPESGLLRAEQAIEKMLAAVQSVEGYQHVPLIKALGRVLHQNIVSKISVPPHTNAAVDGYAINCRDLPCPETIKEIPIVGTALAGQPFEGSLYQNQCIRITTGAPMPTGADTVIMQEDVELEHNFIRVDDRNQPGQNVRKAGEDIEQESTILPLGKLLTPADIGLISSVGIGEIKVKRKPRIAIFSTGDEIHDFGDTLSESGIFDSNRYVLTSAFQHSAIDIIDLGIIPDNKTALRNALSNNTGDVDAIITSGGVSVGQADYVKEIMTELGTVEFWKVAIKPGRPLAFGTINNAVLFGLPGNPVAVMVALYQFVIPTLQKIMGITNPPLVPIFKAKSTERIRKKPGRTEYQRAIITPTGDGDWSVKTTGKQGAGILTSMSMANAFIVLPHDSGSVEPGEFVLVQPFSGLMSI